MTDVKKISGVSFAKAPLDEISGKAAEILALGWKESGLRGDPWAVSFEKVFPDTTTDAEAELRAVMGDYWMTKDDQRAYTEAISAAQRLARRRCSE
ncbi:MAG: hypothetical protein ABSB96_02080 [Gaiellaceae bacterium]